MSRYTDIREVHPGYTTVPCRGCDERIWVDAAFSYNHDYAFCDDHGPDTGNILRHRAEVRI